MVQTANWGILWYLPPIRGTRNNHWYFWNHWSASHPRGWLTWSPKEHVRSHVATSGQTQIRGFDDFFDGFDPMIFITSWWFQIFFIFTLTWGTDSIWLYNVFQMGWNHQLDQILHHHLGTIFFFFSKLRTSKIQARMGLKICPPGFTRNTDLKSRWENPNFPWKISGIWTKRKILGGGYLLGEAKRWPLGNERKRETNYEGGHSNSNNNNNYYYYYYHHPDLFINWICPKNLQIMGVFLWNVSTLRPGIVKDARGQVSTSFEGRGPNESRGIGLVAIGMLGCWKKANKK